MINIMALAWAGKVASALVAFAVMIALLAHFDRRAGVDFKEFAHDLRNDALAAAVYFGLRCVAVGLVVGLVIAFA